MLSTSDIYFAAALMALGAKLKETDKEDPRHMVFDFELEAPKFESPALQAAVENGTTTKEDILKGYEKAWANGDLCGNLIAFAEAIKRLKSIVHTK